MYGGRSGRRERGRVREITGFPRPRAPALDTLPAPTDGIGPSTVTEALIWTVVTINLVTFALYGVDKWKARRGKRRVPEKWLLLPVCATGAVGAWAGVFAFRHKTRKAEFLLPLCLATLLNGVWIWLWLR